MITVDGKRLILDNECAQGKCARPTTGCWGECNLKRSPVVLDGFTDAIRSLSSNPVSLTEKVEVPEGFALVPKQMTVNMALALHGRDGIEQGPGITCVSDETARLYDAMIAAAPHPASNGNGEKGGDHA